MSRRDFRLHYPCACAVDFTRINQEALTRGPQLLVALPRRWFLSIFTDSGEWLDFRAEAQGADLIGFVAHVLHISLRNAAQSLRPLRDNVITSVRPGARRRRGDGRTLFHGGTRSAARPHGDDRSSATISANARPRIDEKAGTDAACGSCGRPNRISVQAEGRHQ
jgi:hypothetical protein